MTRSSVQQYAGVTEAALVVGHRTYPGTDAASQPVSDAVTSYASVAEAALGVGHRTYTGTVAATERLRP